MLRFLAENMAVLKAHSPAGGVPDPLADHTAAAVPVATPPRSRFAQHRKRLQEAVYTNGGDIGYDEVMRVRRWSTSSDELAAETMHNLTSAPRMLIGGRTVFINPNADVKRIQQRPSLRSDGVGVHRHWHRNAPSSGRISAEADVPSVPRDDCFPRHASTSKSLHLPFAAMQADTDMLSRSQSSSLKSRLSSTSSACSELAEDGDGFRRPRAQSLVPDSSSPQKSLARQKSVRTFTPSARFGDPADWKRGASWKQLIQRAQSSDGSDAGVHAGPPAGQSQSLRSLSSDGGDGAVFRPVRPTW